MTDEVNLANEMKGMTYEDKMLYAFLGNADKFYWYKKTFAKYNINGVNNFSWNWSWSAFIFGFLFLFYRKSYFYGFIAFILGILLTPFMLIYKILLGGYATYFIYLDYMNKKNDIEKKVSDESLRLITMSMVGGTNKIMVAILIIFFTFGVIIPMSFILFTMLPPNGILIIKGF